jgi:hypothetical protein
MSAKAGWLSLLVPDERGQRAVQETIADWRADVTEAMSGAARFRAHAVGIASLCRLAIGLLVEQLTLPAVWRTCLITVVVTVLLAAMIGGAETWRIWGNSGSPIAGISALAYGLFLASMISVSLFGVVSALGLGLNDARPSPVLAMCSMLFVFSWLIAHWVSPALFAPLAQQLAKLSPPKLGTPVQAPFFVIAQIVSLSLASTYYLLGSTVRRRLSGFRRLGRQAAALGAVLTLELLSLVAKAYVVGSNISPLGKMTWREIVTFGQLAIAWIAIIWFSRKLKPAASDS